MENFYRDGIFRQALKAKLRQFYLTKGNNKLRAAASLTNVQLLSALFEINERLSAAGLQVRVINGLVSLGTNRIEDPLLHEYLSNEAPCPAEAGEITAAMLEELACIAFKQPVSQSEIDRIFADVDKRSIVAKLREMGLVEDFTGSGGRLHFATTQEFLDRLVWNH